MENEAEASAFKEEEAKTKLIEELPAKEEEGPTIEELPDETETTEPVTKSSILLKDDETPPKKKVTFDIEKTTVKEFYKNEKIEKVAGTPKRKGGKGKNKQQQNESTKEDFVEEEEKGAIAVEAKQEESPQPKVTTKTIEALA